MIRGCPGFKGGVMTKRQYARRLKRMLENAKDNCEQCPCGVKYGYLNHWNKTAETCGVCQDFVGLKYKPWRIGVNACPCFRGNKTQATTRAWKAIRAYEKEEGVVL